MWYDIIFIVYRNNKSNGEILTFQYTILFIQNKQTTMKQLVAILSECDKSLVLLACKQSYRDYKRKKELQWRQNANTHSDT